MPARAAKAAEQRRIEQLEDQLLRAPQRGDLEHMRERLRRKDAMYEAVLARNEVLKRRLDEADGRYRMAERETARGVVSSRATAKEE
jgi:hypothetical protein